MKKMVRILLTTFLVVTFFDMGQVSANGGYESSDNGYNPHVVVDDFHFEAYLKDDGVQTKWTPYATEGFNFYKVIRSRYNSDPVYPDDGYIFYSDNKYEDSYFDNQRIDDSENYFYRVCSIASPERYCSNVVEVYIPAGHYEDGEKWEEEDRKEEKKETEYFNNVETSDWAYEYMMKLSQGDLLASSGNDIAVHNFISRADAVALMVSSYELLNGQISINSVHEFFDVPTYHWAHEYLAKAVSIGMIAENSLFFPDKEIKRSEIAKIIAKTFFLDDIEDGAESLFSDVPSSHWASKYIRVLKDNTLVGGYEDGSYKPEGNISGAEIYKIVVNAIEKKDPEALGDYEPI